MDGQQINHSICTYKQYISLYNTTIEDVSNLKGQIFHYSFSPSNNDSSWIGLNKASHNPHGYIAVSITL